MLRPIEKIGLYILFTLLAVMLLVFLTEVVWGHERSGIWTDHHHHNNNEYFHSTHDDGEVVCHEHDGFLAHADFGQPSCEVAIVDTFVEDDPLTADTDESKTIRRTNSDVYIISFPVTHSHDNYVQHSHDSLDSLNGEHTGVGTRGSSRGSGGTGNYGSGSGTRTVQTVTTFTSAPTPESVKVFFQEVSATPPEMPEEMPKVEVIPEPEIILDRHDQQYWQGFTLVSFPVRPDGIETVGDFFREYEYDGSHGFFDRETEGVILLIDGGWFFYQGEGVLGDVPITPHLGIVLKLDWAHLLGMRGVAQVGGEVDLVIGVNLVGLPEIPGRFKRPSDFLGDGVELVIGTNVDGFFLVGRAGDPGDDLLLAGQALIIISSVDAVLDLSSSTAAAPSAYRMLRTSWGAVKE